MYWLIGSSIIIAMMGVLAVADSMAAPSMSLFTEISGPAVLFGVCTLLAIILLIMAQRRVPSSPSHNPAYSASLPPTSLSPIRYFPRIIRRLLFAGIAAVLVMTSALQALVQHQQAASTAVTQPKRVQALVRIEGLSDSVYDAATHSGYRQVATITQLSPLVSELSAQDLEAMTTSQTTGHLRPYKNSLSYKNNLNRQNQPTKNIHVDSYRVLLSAYPKPSSPQFTHLNQLKPGDVLWMSLALAPLAASDSAESNPTGFDSYRWLRGRHIDGTATIVASSTALMTDDALSALPAESYWSRIRTRIDQERWQLRQHFYQNWSVLSTEEQQAAAVTLSLLTGDRSLISRDTKDLYQLAGISHLLAISGTHVLFLAVLLAGSMARLLNHWYPRLYRRIPRWQVRWWVMIGAAFMYALFTGFDVPAARTAWMLLAIGLVRLTLLPISTMRVLLALAVLMAWWDPYVLWQAGYWLSFIAVALLLKYEDKSHQYEQTADTASLKPYTSSALGRQWWQSGWRLFKLQCWLFITLLPVTLLLFGKASLWGLVINLFAIGLFGWVIVPLNLLAGLCYLVSPVIADGIWSLVRAIIASLHELITAMTTLSVLPATWLYTPVTVAMLLMVGLAILPWLLPRGMLSRWLALPPLSLLVMTVYANQQALMTVPTMYILPTGDRYISAVLLEYPMSDQQASGQPNDGVSVNEGPQGHQKQSIKGSVSWLFLADHRPLATRSVASGLTADTLSATLEQQLGSLSVKKLQGVVVQTSSAGLTNKPLHADPPLSFDPFASTLLPMTVAQMSQHLPISHYWQAGRTDHWQALQQSTNRVQQPATLTVQGCEQGKTWHSDTAGVSVQAITGWSHIDDASVWDCSVAIESSVPIQVVRYSAAHPLKPAVASGQTLSAHFQPNDQHGKSTSRIVLNADTHPRSWQLWSRLCAASPKQDIGFNKNIWLGHSTSSAPTDVIQRLGITTVITYDDKGLTAALPLDTSVTQDNTDSTEP